MGLSWPESLAVKSAVNGLEIDYATASTITIKVGFAGNDSTYDYLISSGVLTVDLTASGAGGLNSGSLEASGVWYHVWVIYNPSTATAAGLFSLSAVDPTLPDGYTLKRRVGTVRNHAGGDLLNFHAEGIGRDLSIHWLEDPLTTLVVLSGGNAAAWTEIDCSSLMPPNSHHGTFWGKSDIKDTELRPKGAAVRTKYIYTDHQETFDMPTDDSQIVEYKVQNVAGDLHLAVQGYHETI